jgi:hypothetical protein
MSIVQDITKSLNVLESNQKQVGGCSPWYAWATLLKIYADLLFLLKALSGSNINDYSFWLQKLEEEKEYMNPK